MYLERYGVDEDDPLRKDDAKIREAVLIFCTFLHCGINKCVLFYCDLFFFNTVDIIFNYDIRRCIR